MKKVLIILSILIAVAAFALSFTLLMNKGKQVDYTQKEISSSNGMEITIEVNDDEFEPKDTIHVKVTLKNITDEPIIYNGRCGPPLLLYIQPAFAEYSLISKEKEKGCEEIFNENDLRELNPGDMVVKHKTFYPKFYINDHKKIHALDGRYLIHTSFQTHKMGRIYETFPITIHNPKSIILSLEKAREIAKAQPETKEWFAKFSSDEYEIKEDTPLLTDEKWFITYQAYKNDKLINHYFVAIDVYSKEVKRVKEQKISKD